MMSSSRQGWLYGVFRDKEGFSKTCHYNKQLQYRFSEDAFRRPWPLGFGHPCPQTPQKPVKQLFCNAWGLFLQNIHPHRIPEISRAIFIDMLFKTGTNLFVKIIVNVENRMRGLQYACIKILKTLDKAGL
jgi:hypothetical protein